MGIFKLDGWYGWFFLLVVPHLLIYSIVALIIGLVVTGEVLDIVVLTILAISSLLVCGLAMAFAVTSTSYIIEEMP